MAKHVSTLIRLIFFTGVLAIGLAACSREQQHWRSAQAADSLEAYDRFLELHPDGELAVQARSRVAQLSEERDWQRTSTSDTADAYKQFLAQHPNGKWAQEARIRLDNFSLEEQPQTASLDTAATALPAVVGREERRPDGAAAYPSAAGPSASVASQALANVGFGIQLGAFSSELKARDEWRRLTDRFRDELSSLQPQVISATTGAGQLFRLQARVLNEQNARSICATLTQKSQACVVVLPQR